VNHVERDGIWHIVARTSDAEAVTVCNCGSSSRRICGSDSPLRCAAAAERAELEP